MTPSPAAQAVADLDPRTNIDDLAAFVTASPTSYHAAAEAARRLRATGFTELKEQDAWGASPTTGKHYVVRDGAIIAWVGTDAHESYRVLGAHTDSPGFKVKPKPSVRTLTWNQVGVEVYGGPLLNSWLDRELRLAGRLTVLIDGQLQTRLVATGPVARIPQLAIHLDRAANEGLKLDKQGNLYPVWGFGDSAGDVLAYLAERAEGGAVDPETIVGYDLLFADAQPPRVFGEKEELFASARLDNLSSVHAGLTALIRYAESGAGSAQTAMLAAFDHEEIGSETRSGAAGPFLEDVLVRLADARGDSPADYRRSVTESICLSSDAGHLAHPNYAGHHDPAVRPAPGGGPLLKINANQRYATDALGAGIFAQACALAEVPYQEFVSNNKVPCGSTIGPITATRLGMRTVDVGVGLLSMHSARELTTVADMAHLTRAIEGFYRI
ncbi:M18 family aminopeptidase [Rothia nasisuis]|uniref:M18 family aminopeptidase n=1 Tax=Rothia nasisuis TaxID=2109647 RepID=UPI001EFF819E|nr:M18 family aminopeptidase [Rothia nasisuis]